MFLKLFCHITCIKKDNEFLRVKSLKAAWIYIVGKGGHTHLPFSRLIPLSKIPPFLEIQDIPNFYRPIGKIKVLNESFNQLLYKFHPQSILILEEYLLKW